MEKDGAQGCLLDIYLEDGYTAVPSTTGQSGQGGWGGQLWINYLSEEYHPCGYAWLIIHREWREKNWDYSVSRVPDLGDQVDSGGGSMDAAWETHVQFGTQSVGHRQDPQLEPSAWGPEGRAWTWGRRDFWGLSNWPLLKPRRKVSYQWDEGRSMRDPKSGHGRKSSWASNDMKAQMEYKELHHDAERYSKYCQSQISHTLKL